jgi:glycosyltransferase involved in cell wall biosynthesis
LLYNGVEYKSLMKYDGSNKLLKYWHQMRSISMAKKIMKLQAAENKLDAVVIFTTEIPPLFFLIKAAKALGIKVFHERTELPHAWGMDSKKRRKQVDYYLHKIVPKFDGIFVISNKLVEYMNQFNKAVKKLVTVVDLDFFSTQKSSPYPFKYIGYCGSITGNKGTKDGVPVLIEAFALIADKFPGHKLVLVGSNTDTAGMKDTTDTIKKLGIEDKVIFTGLVDRDMMPVLLCNAEILAVSKPDNEQNSGNFPIKIGEYLATGVPVVVTKVGEIPLFIKDGESGFLAEPGSAEAFAKKMEEVLSNKERASAAGINGKKVAQENFDYKKVAAVMADYIAEVKNSK